jgi:tight adherence protein C
VIPLLLAVTSSLLVVAALRSQRAAVSVEPREPRGPLRTALTALRRLLPGPVRLLGHSKTENAIARAGLAEQLLPRDVAAMRVACVIAALLLIPRLIATFPPRTYLLIPLLVWAAAELPFLWLARRAAGRDEELRSTLPDALDLMRACLAAGLSLRRSLELVSCHCRPPISTEFVQVAIETAFGRPQALALQHFAERNPLPEIRALVKAIDQAETGGSPLAPVIAAQAQDSRQALNRAIVERGARAGPKIQLVVSATIVPGALLAFAAIVIAAIARGEVRIL